MSCRLDVWVLPCNMIWIKIFIEQMRIGAKVLTCSTQRANISRWTWWVRSSMRFSTSFVTCQNKKDMLISKQIFTPNWINSEKAKNGGDRKKFFSFYQFSNLREKRFVSQKCFFVLDIELISRNAHLLKCAAGGGNLWRFLTASKRLALAVLVVAFLGHVI